jgi:phage shock protein C
MTDKKIAGIFGGVGEVYSIDPTLLRLAAVFLAFCTAVVPFLVAYLVGWVIVPKGPLAVRHAVAEPHATS